MNNTIKKALFGGGLAMVLSIPLIALMFLGARLANLPTAHELIFTLVRDRLPGGVLTAGIDTMQSVFSGLGLQVDTTAKAAESLMAVLVFLAISFTAGIIFSMALRQIRVTGGFILGLFFWAFTLGVQVTVRPGTADFATLALPAIWWGVLFIFWGVALAWSYERLLTPRSDESQPDLSRRRFLAQIFASAGAITLGGVGLGFLLGPKSTSSSRIANLPTMEPTKTPSVNPTATTPSSFVPAPDTRDEQTALDRFYRVDINPGDPPDIDQPTWTLQFAGLVNNQYSLSYDDLLKLPFIEQDVTLECISNTVGGRLMGETRWQGIKLADMLKLAGVQSGVKEIRFLCSDGYTESLPLDVAMDENTLLVYGMNGKPLPYAHGFPVRVIVPNHYGMKNPKWIERIEAINEAYDGYWEQRGWNKDAVIKTTSATDTQATTLIDQTAPLGGIAFAGARSISKVEVSIDNGDWQVAQIKPPLSTFTWVLWRLDIKIAAGMHKVRVRATDGQGNLQTDVVSAPHPDGASGYHTQDVNFS